MAQTRNLSDPYDRMKFMELMLTNWCQKKFRHFAKQLEELSPYSDGKADLLLGLCYLHGWGVWKNRDTAEQYFSKLHTGKVVWFGHHVAFMECEVVNVQGDRVLLREKKIHMMPVGYGMRYTFPPKAAVTWDCCLARKWMNTEYLEDTFYKHERDLILKTKNTTPQNPFAAEKVSVKDSTEKIFPLSIQEYMDFRGLQNAQANRISWYFSTEGPEAVYAGSDYIYRVTKRESECNAIYFGHKPDELQDVSLKEHQGSFFRTPGNSEKNRAFVINGLIFYDGETRDKIKNSDIKIGYNPAFWLSLK